MIQIQRRIVSVFFSSSLLWALPGCERALEVVDQLNTDPPGSGSAEQPGGEAAPSVQNASCACASSASLTALSCGGGEVPQIANDIVQTTVDGAVVLFNRCDIDPSGPCEVMYWRGGNPTSLGNGFVVGLDASGEHASFIPDSAPDSMSLVSIEGGSTSLPVGMLYARGSLTASGDTVFASGRSIDGDPIPANHERLVRANAAGQIEKLGDLPGSVVFAAINPEGTRLVGSNFDTSDIDNIQLPNGFRWSEEGGLRFDFPGAPEGAFLWPEALSDDGAIIAGRSGGKHFTWSEADGYAEIASTSGFSETFISADGSVVLGSLIPEPPAESAAFRWTAQEGAVNLTPGRASRAVDMSDDGGVIVASSSEPAQLDGAPPEDTFVWDSTHGTRTLDEALAQRGVDTSGWEFGVARVLSGNGKVLLGRATCGGVPTLYRVVLSD